MPQAMNASKQDVSAEDQDAPTELDRLFILQKTACLNNPLPAAGERIAHLQRLKKSLVQYKDKLAAAVNADFGARSHDETWLAEVVAAIEGIKHNVRHIKKWMKPSRHLPGMLYLPAAAKVYYQPLGVVGIISPWNYPVYLSVGGPLVSVLAAGNRVILRVSREVPRTAEVLKQLIGDTFTEDQVALLTGQEVSGRDFTAIPWDHLVFTGSTRAGKQVMRAAADNLTPVTLELGGKSPAIVSAEVPIKDAARRIAWGKMLNAGQTCVAPDYVLCPESRVGPFIDAVRQAVAGMYPSLKHNPDFTGVENDQQYEHLQGLLQDAREKGAEIIVINPDGEDFSGTRKLPLHIILKATDEMAVLKKEIFGPILPIIPYRQITEAVAYINHRPRPLALYYFDYNRQNAEYIINNTHSGGVLINDTIVHVPQDTIPFGGIGQSGMGHYHGRAGFLAFSKEKGVLFKPKFNTGKLIYPPYGKRVHQLIYKMLLK